MRSTAWLVPLADKVPEPNDVVAGWTGFAVFVFLCVSLALLMFSFAKRLRKTREHFGVDRQGNPIEPESDESEAEASSKQS